MLISIYYMILGFKISGYAWDPKHLQIKLGDTVQWEWKFAPFIQGMKIRVAQVKDLLSQEEEEEGFNSGPATSKGILIVPPVNLNGASILLQTLMIM